MAFQFEKLKSNPNQFFDILPGDWQDEIVPFWDDYINTASIYVIKEDSHVIAGGILFSTCSPDILYFKKEAQTWFKNGFLYIGFLWVAEDKRNNNLGSFWLDELKRQLPNDVDVVETIVQNKPRLYSVYNSTMHPVYRAHPFY